MDNKIPLISYTLAAMSGICFVGGLVLISSERRQPEWRGLVKSYQR